MLWGPWDRGGSKVFQAYVDPQDHQEFKVTTGLRAISATRVFGVQKGQEDTRDHRVLPERQEILDHKGCQDSWDREVLRVWKVLVDSQVKRGSASTKPKKNILWHLAGRERRAPWDRQDCRAKEELPAIAVPPVPPVKWACRVQRVLRAFRGHPEHEASQACQVFPDFRVAALQKRK